jgi:hypothetical protein
MLRNEAQRLERVGVRGTPQVEFEVQGAEEGVLAVVLRRGGKGGGGDGLVGLDWDIDVDEFEG